MLKCSNENVAERVYCVMRPTWTYCFWHPKTYLRNSMGDSRLSGLALLSIHREIEVNPAEVLDRFAKAPRRDKLLL